VLENLDGKSFLTRLLLSGIIRKQAAVNLIFDMHSEYGWEATSEGKHFSAVKGLRQLFPDKCKSTPSIPTPNGVRCP